MATMTTRQPGGATTFVVPILGRQPDAPFVTGHAELIIETAPPDHNARKVSLRFFPGGDEFRLKLSRVLAGSRFRDDAWAIARASVGAQPVVTYVADASVAAQLDPGLDSLAAVEAMLAQIVPVFEPGRYTLASVEITREP